MKRLFFLFFLFSLFILQAVRAQIAQYPVQVITQVSQSTPYVPQYYTGTFPKLRVTLNNLDFQNSTLQVVVRMRITSSSFSLYTPDYLRIYTATLDAGRPLQLSGEDLAVFFRNENYQCQGNRSEFLRTQQLPDDVYTFHFDVFDAATGQRLSSPTLGRSRRVVRLGKPPVPIKPKKEEVITESSMPNILFNWKTATSLPVGYRAEYELTLVEIYDKQVPPEGAFAYSRVIFSERTPASSFIYNSSHPMLIPGMRYAWQVRAIAKEGVSFDEIPVIENNGYSQVFWFDYAADCKQVQTLGAIYENNHVNITWQDVNAMEYQVEYRKKGSDKWYTGNITQPSLCPVYNLSFGKEYEYRIGTRCVINDIFQYSAIKSIQIPDKAEKGPDCGIMPDTKITNKVPAQQLQHGLPVLAGDFPVFITKVNGSGRFSGEGYVGIPYLSNAQVAVTFDNIVINTDNQLIEGYFETKYDAEKAAGLFSNDTPQDGAGVGDNTNYTVDFSIDSNITVLPVKVDDSKDEITEGEDYQLTGGENSRYIVTIYDTDGNPHEIVVDSFPATLIDNNGNEYTLEIKESESGVSEVVVSASPVADKTVKFKIDENFYSHNQTYTTLYTNKNLRIELFSANETDTIKWENLDLSVKKKKWVGSDNYTVALQKDSTFVDNQKVIIRYVQVLLSSSTLNENNELIVTDKSTNREVAKLKIETYHAPVVKFDMGNNYNGSYFFCKGFDEQTNLKKPLSDGNGYYDTLRVGKNGDIYYTPVLGLSVDKTVTIKVDINDFENKIANDTTFRVVIKARDNGIVSLNNRNDSIVLNQTELNQLKSTGLRIQSLRAINEQTLTPSFIDVLIQSTREKIGQLEYYSAAAINLNVQLIYVKFSDESRFPDYVTPTSVQNYLQTQSLNQLFVNITVDSTHVNSRLRKSDLNSYASSQAVLDSLIKDIFNGPTLQGYNRSNDCYFITNLEITKPNGDKLGGAHRTNNPGGLSVKNFSVAGETNEELIAHELGHYLGLPHTFESRGVIPVINSSESGTKNNGDNFMDYNLKRKRWFKIQLNNYIRER